MIVNSHEMEAREKQIRALLKDEGWNELVKPYIERRIGHYRGILLSGSSANYASDVAIMKELEGILSNVDRIRAEVEALRQQKMP